MSKPRGKGSGGAKGKGVRKPPGGGGRVPPKRPVTTGEEAHLPWSRRNTLLLGLGGIALVLGFLLLALGDTVVAPLLLVGGYLGLIPWGIVAATRENP